MLTVVDGVDESVFEFVVTAEKFWFDEVNHGKVLIEVVLEGTNWSLTKFCFVGFYNQGSA